MADVALSQAVEPPVVPPEAMDVDQTKWADEIALLRYIFLRSIEPNFVNRQSLLTHPIEGLDYGENSVITHLKALADRDVEKLAKIFLFAVRSESLQTREQLLWCLAFCLRSLQPSHSLNTLLRSDLKIFANTSRNLLVLIHFYKFWGPRRPERPVSVQILRSGQKRSARRKKRKDGGSLSFPKGMRVCLKRWYESWSYDELIEVLYATAAVQGVKHNDIIRLIHLYSVPKPKNEQQKAKKLKREKAAEARGNPWPKREKAPVDDRRKLITDATSWSVKTLVKKAEEHKSEWILGHDMAKVITYQHLKVTMKEDDLVAMLKKGKQNYSFKINHLTPDGIKKSTVSLILSDSNLSEAIEIICLMNKRKMINTTKTVSLINRKVDVSTKAIKAAHLNPFHVFQTRQDVITRYKQFTTSGKELEDGFAKSHEKLVDQLLKIGEMSLQELNTKDTRTYYVTLDFRNFSKRQAHVSGMTKMPCGDLQIIFALWMLRNKKNVVLKAFTDDRNILQDVAWNAQTTFDGAMEWYAAQKNARKRTKEHFVFPMQKAREDGKKVDVFITFVSSIARTVGGNAKPPFEELHKYREAQSQPDAKLILVNLTRQISDLVYSKRDDSELGILEIVGFHVDGMKIIMGYVDGAVENLKLTNSKPTISF